MGMDRLADQVEKERRDVEIFLAVVEEAPVGIAGLAEVVDLPEHKVRQSLRMLENDDLVEPTADGTVPADDVDAHIESMNAGIDRLVDRVAELKTIFPADDD